VLLILSRHMGRLEAAVAATEGKVHLAIVDIDELGDLALDHGVEAVPTVIAVKVCLFLLSLLLSLYLYRTWKWRSTCLFLGWRRGGQVCGLD
jgi:hypothetical protein